jgi:hypothetical protein
MDKIPESPSAYDMLSDASDKVESFQKKYNISSKNMAYIIGKNLSLFLCLLVPVLLIGSIWTELGDIVIGPRLVPDATLTIILFALGETMMIQVGTGGGKLDDEFLQARNAFETLVCHVDELGTKWMSLFCEIQIAEELEKATRIRLAGMQMTLKMWEEIKDKPYAELKQKYGKSKAKKLESIREMKPIELNEAILLYGGEYNARGGVPMSAEEFLKDKLSLAGRVLGWVFGGFLVVNIAFTMTSDVTIARVFYTVFKLAVLLFRMAKGYDRGARAYNTVEVRNYKAKCNYLRQYIKFVDEKGYLKASENEQSENN